MRERDDWRTMETAPKDGSLIEGFDPRNLNNIQGYRGWRGPMKWSRWGYWRKMHRNGFANMVAEPTHWRPFPHPQEIPHARERREAE